MDQINLSRPKDLETAEEERAWFNSNAGRFANIYNQKKFNVVEVMKTNNRETGLQIIQDRIRELEEFLYEPQIEQLALRDLYRETLKHATEEEREYLRKRDLAYKPKKRTPENEEPSAKKLTPFESAIQTIMKTMEKIGQPVTKDQAIKMALAQDPGMEVNGVVTPEGNLRLSEKK